MSRTKKSARSEAYDHIARSVDIADLAKQLGCVVVDGQSKSPRTLCPFHDDRTPSLHLYRESQAGRGHYHCFACGAHGDVFDLVQKLRGVEFREAAEWLARRQGIELAPFRERSSAVRSARSLGLERAFDAYRAQSDKEKGLLAAFADARGYGVGRLRRTEIFAARGQKLSNVYGDDIEAGRELEEAGLLVRDERSTKRSSGQRTLPLPVLYRDLFWADRIVFALRDSGGELVGFAARRIEAQESGPKYLYSQGFGRKSYLYRFDQARAAFNERSRAKAKNDPGVFDLYLVEGLLDALRLEVLGLSACAVLGSQLTEGQQDLLIQLAAEAETRGAVLALHVCFDGDEAGRRGAAEAVVRLWKASAKRGVSPFVDVVSLGTFSDPRTGATPTTKSDPDSALRAMPGLDEAQRWLRERTVSGFAALVAHLLEVEPSELRRAWAEAVPARRQWVCQRLAEKFSNLSERRKILDGLQPFSSATIEDELMAPVEGGPRERIEPFLRAGFASESLQESKDGEQETRVSDLSDTARLQVAFRMATASRQQRREFPLDEGSWERLGAGFSVMAEVFKEHLEGGRKRAASEPFLAVYVPKGESERRLKALPCPEALTLQQYVLNELLRDYADSPSFSATIPAVRYSRGRGRPFVTGVERNSEDEPPSSYAHQIDMDIVNGLSPPGASTMFRPFQDCWGDFIRAIEESVERFEDGQLYALRLDIRGFYDNLPRWVVVDALLGPLKAGLAQLENPERCAPLLKVQRPGGEDRAKGLVDWLCDESFGYQYFDPDTGEPVTNRAEAGVPQGPDLSAYLANVSLLRLDQSIENRVSELNKREAARGNLEDGQCVAFYARYVDDMVLIARDHADLEFLHSAVFSELRRLGLELNHKADPLPPMSKRQLRGWLTEHRWKWGLTYGPVPIESEVEAELDRAAFGGAQVLDRGQALLLLHGSRMLNPSTPREEVVERVALARQADEVRFGDQLVAAKALWRVVAQEIESGQEAEHSPSREATQARGLFADLWRRTAPPTQVRLLTFEDSGREATQINWGVLAALEGLQNFLRDRGDRSLGRTSEEQRTWRNWQLALARLVVQGLCFEIVDRGLATTWEEGPPEAGNSAPLAHMTDLRIRAVIATALTVLGEKEAGEPPPAVALGRLLSSSLSPAQIRFQISIAHSSRQRELLDRAEPQSSSLLLAFHEAIVRLRLVDQAQREDPLEPLRRRMNSKQRRSGALASVLHFWLAPEGTATSSTAKGGRPDFNPIWVAGLSSFVNVAQGNAATLMKDRPTMKVLLAELHSLGNVRFVEPPPGLPTKGLVAVVSDERASERAIRFEFRWSKQELQEPTDDNAGLSEDSLTVAFSPPDLVWEAVPAAARAPAEDLPLSCFSAELQGWRLEEPQHRDSVPEPDSKRLGRLDQLVKLVRSLNGHVHSSTYEGTCPPTAFNLVCRQVPDSDRHEWCPLGYAVGSEDLGNSAFIRSPAGLVSTKVPAEGAPFWRNGLAACDFLGFPQRFAECPSSAISAPSSYLPNGGDWSVATLVHLSVYRLCGKGVSIRPLRAGTNGQPWLMERALQQIEQFPRDSAAGGAREARLAMVLAGFAEARLLKEQEGSTTGLDEAGGPAAWWGRWVPRLLGHDAKLAGALPMFESLPSWTPTWRSARPWFALAERLDPLVSEVRRAKGEALSLAYLAQGLRLVGLAAQLRTLAISLWHGLTSDQRAKAQGDIETAAWSLPPAPVLLLDGESNELSLLHRLSQATSTSVGKSDDRLYRVTPLGWLVLAGYLSGQLPGKDRRFGLLKPDELDAEDAKTLAHLAEVLATSSTDDESGPWAPARGLLEALSPDLLRACCEALGRLARAAGLEERDELSSQFSVHWATSSGAEKDTAEWVEVYLGTSGASRIPGWALVPARLSESENRAGIETVPQESTTDQRVRRRGSSAWRGSTLLAVGYCSQGLAELAGIDLEPEPRPVENQTSASDRPYTPTEPATVLGVPVSEPDTASPPQQGSQDGPAAQSGTELQANVRLLGNSGPSSSGRLDWRAYQRDVWRSRASLKRRNTGRIALLQWRVEESYHHPLIDVCCVSREQRQLRCEPETRSGESHEKLPYLASCSEYRRRRVLAEVLNVCRDFDVDVLVLPEYSVRPETVRWLLEEGLTGHKTSVWAGTYRCPTGYREGAQDQDPQTKKLFELERQAVLSRVLPEGLGSVPRLDSRAKKYPSLALDEDFIPGPELLRPLFAGDRSRFDIRNFLLELICSEIFVASSAANAGPLVSALHRLRLKHKPGMKTAFSREECFKELQADLKAIGEHLEFESRYGFPRRSILVVPAITPRVEDYFAFGQSNYLAAGLTTVFCNAVHSKYGKGKSCFLGLDGWDLSAGKQLDEPSSSPYHGLLPGLYGASSLGRGSLGESEQALVIADIDPVYATLGKPRPQTLEVPLALVAHLPILESWRRPKGLRASLGSSAKCLCQQVEPEELDSREPGFQLAKLLDVLEPAPTSEPYAVSGGPPASTAGDLRPEVLAGHLDQLAKRFDPEAEGDWLCKRAKRYRTHHLIDPQTWPPPAAVDWIWVDLGETGKENYPEIEVPPFSFAESPKPDDTVEEKPKETDKRPEK